MESMDFKEIMRFSEAKMLLEKNGYHLAYAEDDRCCFFKSYYAKIRFRILDNMLYCNFDWKDRTISSGFLDEYVHENSLLFAEKLGLLESYQNRADDKASKLMIAFDTYIHIKGYELLLSNDFRKVYGKGDKSIYVSVDDYDIIPSIYLLFCPSDKADEVMGSADRSIYIDSCFYSDIAIDRIDDYIRFFEEV